MASKPKPSDPVKDVLDRYEIKLSSNESIVDSDGNFIEATFILRLRSSPSKMRKVMCRRSSVGTTNWTAEAPYYAEHKAPIYIAAVRSYMNDNLYNYAVVPDLKPFVNAPEYIELCPLCDSSMVILAQGEVVEANCVQCSYTKRLDG